MDSNEFKKLKEAGEIASKARDYGETLIQEGAILSEVADKIEEKIKVLGGLPAFPAQISIGKIAAHYCPTYSEEVKFSKGDIVKLDVGVHIDGFVADTAVTVNIGEQNKELKQASLDALNVAIKTTRPGVKLLEIGKNIQEVIESYGFRPVRNLSGHGVGKYLIHTIPSIPNFNNGDDRTLKEDMTIAIEPFASTGEGMIREEGKPTIFSLVNKKPIRNPYARKVLKEIEQYKTLPFAFRWLEKKFKQSELSIAFRELNKLGIIRGYPPLPDVKKGLISQHEHTLIVKDKPIITTKSN